MDRGTRIFVIMLGCAVLAAVAFWYLDIGERTYGSPQECFDAATAALKKNDMRGFCECLTSDSRDLMAASAVLDEFTKKQMPFPGKEKSDSKAIDEVFANHGLTTAFLDKAQPAALTVTNPQAPVKEKVAAAQIILEPVSDRNALIADIFKTAMKGATAEHPFDGLKNAKLGKVEIEGRKAKAEVSRGGDMPLPINFAKQGEGWRIDLFPDRPMPPMHPGMFQHP